MSLVCTNKICQVPTATDKVKNGNGENVMLVLARSSTSTLACRSILACLGSSHSRKHPLLCRDRH